jgi:hypothetical protein
MYTYFSRFLLALLLLPVFTFAQAPEETKSQFQQLFTVAEQEIVVPTVVEVLLPETAGQRTQFLVVDDTTDSPVGSLYQKSLVEEPVEITIEVNGTQRPNLVDQEQETSETFPVPTTESGKVELFIAGDEAFTASSFVLDLAKNVSLPISIEVRAEVDGSDVIVLAPSQLRSTLVLFPETTATNWYVALQYIQPLRINELRFVQVDAQSQNENTLRFLAQPERTYTVYVDPETYVQMPVVEAGNLRADDEVVILEGVAVYQENPQFQFADSDKDTIPDQFDNCVTVANPDQLDVDKNGRGDVCDDFDRDGVLNSVDNCQNDPNRNQADEDGDGIGDTCDEEESRVTEKYGWIPWAAMAGAILVFILLFWIMIRRMHGEIGHREERVSMKNPKSDKTNT